ncbi:MAG: DUF4440 domain-containing protein [Pseudomonadota bacterium]
MELTIEQLIAKLDRAISGKDIDAVRKIYDGSACLVRQPGDFAYGIDEIIEHYESLFSLNIPMTVSTQLLKTVETKNLALITTKWVLEGIDPDGNEGRVEKIANIVAGKNGESEWRVLIENPFGPELLDED